MISNEKQFEILERITASATFASSNISKELLIYLVKAAQAGQVPKEVNIATEVLGRDASFDPSSDPYVRSSIFNLRKRLAKYYESEGKDDPIRLVVPKGSYRVQFIKAPSQDKNPRMSARYIVFALLALSIIANIVLVGPLLFSSKKSSAYRHHVWNSFKKSKLPILLVVGDFLTFAEIDESQGVERSVRDHRINTPQQFDEIAKKFPNRQMRIETDYRSFDWSAVDNFVSLASIFQNSGKNIFIKRASKLQWEDTRINNIIYQGSPLSLHILGHFLETTHFRTNIEDYTVRDVLYQVDEQGNTISSYKSTGRPNTGEALEGYVLWTLIPGPSDNSIMLIVGPLEMSRTFLVKQLASLDFLQEIDQEFQARLNHVPDYFEILFKVKGFASTGLSQEIVYLGELSAGK